MKLYYAPGVCSLSPHIVLRETNTPFTLFRVDLKTKTVAGGGNYLLISPAGYVPALELDDGTVITEGPAILQYVADRAGARELAPTGLLERTQMQSWLNFISTELHKGFSPLFHPEIGDPARAIFRETLLKRLAYLDAHLSERAYIMGASFTLPDAYAFTVTTWARPAKLDLSGLPHLQAYRDRIRKRPTVEAAMRAEGLIK